MSLKEKPGVSLDTQPKRETKIKKSNAVSRSTPKAKAKMIFQN